MRYLSSSSSSSSVCQAIDASILEKEDTGVIPEQYNAGLGKHLNVSRRRSFIYAAHKLLNFDLNFVANPAIFAQVSRVCGRRVVEVPVLKDEDLVLPFRLVAIELGTTTAAANNMGEINGVEI
mmetsp:Transcript_81768/g.163271  ORF Transcript_81768/g.163271 Transcript_81768/m.163271 type:complete len:123 (+) Transcript_81768:893-1261(+)